MQEHATGLWWLNVVHETSQVCWRGGSCTQKKLSREDPQLLLASQILALCPNAKCSCSGWMWDLHPGISYEENLLLMPHFQERLSSVRFKYVWGGNVLFHVHSRKVHVAKSASCFACVWTEPSCWEKAFGKCRGENVMLEILFYFGLPWGWVFCVVWDVMLLWVFFLDIACIVPGNKFLIFLNIFSLQLLIF